jgi:membrane-bound lytic murein transglycosylase D
MHQGNLFVIRFLCSFFLAIFLSVLCSCSQPFWHQTVVQNDPSAPVEQTHVRPPEHERSSTIGDPPDVTPDTNANQAAANTDQDPYPAAANQANDPESLTAGAYPDQSVRENAANASLDQESLAAATETENHRIVPILTGEDLMQAATEAQANGQPPVRANQYSLDEALDFCQAAQDFWQKGELENALEALDQAYSLILNVDTYDRPKLMQQKEDLRFLISKRILEIYASRNIVVNGGHNAIPIELNKHVQREIKLFTKGKERQFFIDSYRRSGQYRPQIVEALRAAGLPEELSWVPLIESGFKVRALSRARALGLWQFIPSTGYKFGLKRDKYIDERIDPEKSTAAAIAYLKELHSIFGDWATVLAAYNCGEGRVLRVIRTQNINYLDNFWDLYERLPRETARYVPRFLATLHILQNKAEYGIDVIALDAPLEYETVEITRQVQLKDIAPHINTTARTLVQLNPELRHKILPPDRYELKVPPQSGAQLLAVLDDIPISYPPRPAYIYHRVRYGETLSTIAERYRTSMRKIMRANGLRRSHYIVAGQKLKIPQRGTVITRANRKPPPGYEMASTHIVRSGDSLWIIAKMYNTTTKQIQQENNLYTTKLTIGQELKIPGRQPTIKPPSNGHKTYTVRRGDSPYRIAVLHNMPLERFLRLNDLTPRSKIYPGQQVAVE